MDRGGQTTTVISGKTSVQPESAELWWSGRRGRWTAPLPGSCRPQALGDHGDVPRGTASRRNRRYAVRLTVPRRGGWRAGGTVRADFERALADPADPASPRPRSRPGSAGVPATSG